MEVIIPEDFIRSLKATLETLGVFDELHPESNTPSSNPNYTTLFLSFLKSSVMLDCEWTVKVTPKAWALSFMQLQLEDIVATLSQFVFNEEELFNRNISLSHNEKSAKEAISRLPFYKVNAIKNAAFWLKSKNRDPWSYVPPTRGFNIPEEDVGQIEKGLLKFQTVVENGPFLLDSLFQNENQSDSTQFSISASLQVKVLSNMPSVLTKLCNPDDQLIFNEDFSKYDQIFGVVEGLLLLGQADILLQHLLPGKQQQPIKTNVDLLRVLTMKQFSHREDFSDSFFDAMQVSQSSLKILERRRDHGFGNCVRSLFRMQYIRYRGNKSEYDPQARETRFTGILDDSIAAVLILSSIRCVAWLDKNFHVDEKFDRQKIQNYYPADVIFPGSSYLTEVFQQLQDSCTQANFDFLGSPKSREPQSQVQMEVDLQEFQSFQQENHLKTRPTDSSNDNRSTLNQLPSSSPASSSNSPSYAAIMSAIRDDLASNEDEREVSRDLVKTKFMCDSLGHTTHVVLMDFVNVEFPIKLVSEAFLALQTASGRKDPEFEAGKVLFIGLFTPYEIFHGSLSGRKREKTGATTLGFFTNPELKPKSRALLEMLRFLSSISTRLSVSDLLTPKQKLMRVHAKATHNVETLKRKIFVEYRKQRAKDMTSFMKNNITISI